MARSDGIIVMEDVTIIFRNFTGREGPYNEEGKKTFGVLLNDEIADTLSADGWNVKMLEPREENEDDRRQPWMPVKVKYGGAGRPPRIVVINEDGEKEVLEEAEVEMLDWVDIVNADLTIRPYSWSQPEGKSGITAYLQSLWVTVHRDPLERKYAKITRARDEQR